MEMDVKALTELKDKLRNLPAGFEWNFAECGHCAMALLFGPEIEDTPTPFTTTADRLGITPIEARRLFGSGRISEEMMQAAFGPVGIDPWTLVTPEMVADGIEKFLAERTKR